MIIGAIFGSLVTYGITELRDWQAKKGLPRTLILLSRSLERDDTMLTSGFRRNVASTMRNAAALLAKEMK